MGERRITLREAVDNPEILEGKSLVIEGNFSDFKIVKGIAIRKFTYIPETKRWFVQDMDLGDGFSENYFIRFSKKELEKTFPEMLDYVGYIRE